MKITYERLELLGAKRKDLRYKFELPGQYSDYRDLVVENEEGVWEAWLSTDGVSYCHLKYVNTIQQVIDLCKVLGAKYKKLPKAYLLKPKNRKAKK